MCGRFVLKESSDDLGAFFEVDRTGEGLPMPSWNISPTQMIPVVVASAKGEDEPVRRLEPARWSLVPGWSKDLALKFPTFNARSEGIDSKSTWKASIKSKRAIVPASGYYEWRTDADKSKHPHFIHDPSGQPLAFAGLYSWWADPSKPKDDDSRWLLLTATILTSPAVPHLAAIHARNPVPLPRDAWDWWLDPTVEGDQSLVDAAVEAARPVAESLELYEVKPLRGNGPELLEAI